MRARYTAYALGDVSFIINTTDPKGPMWEANRERWTQSIIEFGSSFQFTGVDILRADPPDADLGWVTFRAGLLTTHGDQSFTEKSMFTREGGIWRYHSGERVHP